MKFLFAAAASLFIASSSFAEILDTNELASLTQISKPQIIISNPGVAAVQPRASLSFAHSSCAKQPFELEVSEVEGVFLVKAILPAFSIDCFGPSIEHTYTLQVTADFSPQKRVLVLNPIAPKYSNAVAKPSRAEH
ncbi:MAG: hypothetical protein NTV34_11350 [Proteobacteria bacterium]|nr:hypothetical protein [Pseudomonadota bacterium]